MKINEYKNDVNSLTLSAEFKQELKEKMMAAAESSSATKRNITKSAVIFSSKYSRYIALAACLLLVVSTVSVVSIGGLKAKDSSGPKSSEDTADELVPNVCSDMDTIDDSLGENNTPTDFDDIADSESDNSPDHDTPDDRDYEPTATPVPPNEDDIAPESIPAGNGYSIYASPEYDGDYYGDDYVISNNLGPADNTAYTVFPDVKAMGIKMKTVKPNGDEDALNPPSNVDDSENEAYDAAGTYTYEELTSGQSYSYYDVRDRVIAKLNGIALIRFTVKDSYYGTDEVASNISNPVSIDAARQTLYRIKITHEYISNEEKNVERLLINDGGGSLQLAGRPLMTGEYIALVTESDDGMLTPIPQLIYAVHRVNGLDIAYHVYSDDGFLVDPGSTNMGLMPEEREVVTSTKNNPEIYTQKAAVRELTYYVRRNLLRLDPTILDLEKVSSPNAPDDPEDQPDNNDDPSDDDEQPEDIEYRPAIKANFPTGSLKVTDEAGEVKVNGIGVGDDMQTALKAFYLTDYNFTPDATLTLIASEEDGRWQVIVKFIENTVASVEVKK